MANIWRVTEKKDNKNDQEHLEETGFLFFRRVLEWLFTLLWLSCFFFRDFCFVFFIFMYFFCSMLHYLIIYEKVKNNTRRKIIYKFKNESP